jgi:hypothetical protein
MHYPYAGPCTDGRDGDGAFRGAPHLNCPIEDEEILGIRLGFSQGKSG